MRVIVTDYSGHPFQVQLSRALADRGHEVLHVYSASFQTPKGELERKADDPATFDSAPVTTRQAFAKDSFLKRRAQEIEIGDAIAAKIKAFGPEVVISSNAPLDAQRRIQRASRRIGARFIFWVQDLYGEAILSVVGRKFGALGGLIGRYYQRMEFDMLRRSDHIVVISEEFRANLAANAGIDIDGIAVIENWAPLHDLPQYERDNSWAAANLSQSPFRVIYSGTLGFKHDPLLLLALAEQIDGDVLVFSEGKVADELRERAKRKNVTNLLVRGWLPFEDLPKALAAADVLIVVLEPDAGAFSVPSKVLTYLCVGRPIVGSINGTNLAAKIINENTAGLTFEPGEHAEFIAAVRRLCKQSTEREAMGKAARAYAERTFDIDRIADRFQELCEPSSEKLLLGVK